jgi:RNA polymerase sigma factor (sigma-70 family)
MASVNVSRSPEAPDGRLSVSEEERLVRQAQGGDPDARQRLIDAHYGLAYHLAKLFHCSGFEFEDLLQEGLLGMMRALDRFDPSRGCRFATYATYWMRQGIQRSIDRRGRLIGLPVDLIHSLRRIEAANAALTRKNGHPPDPAELAEAAGVSQQRLRALLLCHEAPLSLEDLAGENDARKPREPRSDATLDPEEILLRSALKEEIRCWLSWLPEVDRLVLQGRYGLEGRALSEQDFLARYGLDHEAVLRIQRRAMRRLRAHLTRRASPPAP